MSSIQQQIENGKALEALVNERNELRETLYRVINGYTPLDQLSARQEGDVDARNYGPIYTPKKGWQWKQK